MENEIERNVLRDFFEAVVAKPQDNSISDSKLVRDTKGKLSVALKRVANRCTCVRRSYGPCEVCQASDDEIVALRNFYRVMSKAKKHNMTAQEIMEFVANTQDRLSSAKARKR